jgi:hypothetical protein
MISRNAMYKHETNYKKYGFLTASQTVSSIILQIIVLASMIKQRKM